jgi:3-oxoacyl-(acyl-carrier-protein) synthase
MKVYITGIGAVSALGLNAEENLNAIRSERTGIHLSDQYQLMLAAVRWSNAQLMQMLQLPDEDYSRTTLLGLMAAKEAWEGHTRHPEIRSGLISATSIGGLDRMEQHYFERLKAGISDTDHRMIHENGRTTEKMAQALEITGYINTISTACSSGANAIMQGARMITGNRLDRVLVGGSDPITLFNIKGFTALNIYDPALCKPFDDTRKGLNLGEGAGFLVLENEHSLSITNNKPICVLSGWNNATDAYHQTASSPTGEGAYLAMHQALAKAGISPEKIDYINAHGTGTGNNDLSESIAIQRMFGENVPKFSSTKGFTGHTLAAAGALEAIYCVQSIQHQGIPPNLHFTTPMKETGMIPPTTYLSGMPVENVLSNSFGFGGNCTCLIFSKV